MKKIIVLHGALGSQAQLKPVKELLSQFYEVYGFDFSGHGGSPFKPEFSINQFSAELEAFVLRHNLNNTAVFGYSMGGFAALNLAKDNPGLLGEIITLGTKFDWNEESASKEVKHLIPEKIEEKVPHFAQVLKERHAPIDWKENMQKTAQMMLDLGAGGSIEFAKVSNKVLLMLAEEDSMVSVEETKTVDQILPNSSFKLLKNSKHPIEKVDLSALVSEITSFLK